MDLIKCFTRLSQSQSNLLQLDYLVSQETISLQDYYQHRSFCMEFTRKTLNNLLKIYSNKLFIKEFRNWKRVDVSDDGVIQLNEELLTFFKKSPELHLVVNKCCNALNDLKENKIVDWRITGF